jgi:hypothetical protein
VTRRGDQAPRCPETRVDFAAQMRWLRRDGFHAVAQRQAFFDDGCLGHPVQWLAYSEGGDDARVARLARRAGYVLAVTTPFGAAKSGAARLALHRYEILDTTGVSGPTAVLGG